MKILKSILKVIGKILLVIVGLLLIYWFAQWGLSKITIDAENETKEKTVEIFILTNGVHTDIVMPVQNDLHDWRSTFSYEHTLSRDSSPIFVAVGWGDKGFYLETPEWKDLKPSIAFNAMFALGESAAHVTFYHEMNEGQRCRSIHISDQQYLRLVHYINETLDRNESSQSIFIETDAQYGVHDAFYEAQGSYSLFFTCNTWANTALKECGQNACLWTVFDTPIFEKYQL